MIEGSKILAIGSHAHSLTPDVRWDGSRARCEYLEDEDR